jgi:hypothetical protein
MTPNEVITEVRRLIQDTKVTFRYSDTVLLGFVNQTLKKMAVLRPDLFAVISDFTTVANTVLQSCPTDSVRLMQIFQIKSGDAVTEVSKETLDQMYPNWVNETAGIPVNFMRHVRNPNKFFIYPRPSAGVILVGEYAQSPATYAINDTVALLPDAYLTSVVEGAVYLAESVDNEHVNSGRAKLFQDAFVQGLGVSLQSRVITDTEAGGLDPKQVI